MAMPPARMRRQIPATRNALATVPDLCAKRRDARRVQSARAGLGWFCNRMTFAPENPVVVMLCGTVQELMV
jgi:hypothetical protein